jgi:hypothetical protein
MGLRHEHGAGDVRDDDRYPGRSERVLPRERRVAAGNGALAVSGVSIELYTGMQGGGKTYGMVAEVILPALRLGSFDVVSNLAVKDWKSGRSTRQLDISGGFEQLASMIEANLGREAGERRDLVIAIDELGVAMPAELWRSDGAMEVIALCLQMRKARCDFVGTVQHFERAVKVLRDNVNIVHKCRMYWRHPWKRDRLGPVNRRTGRPYCRPWFFEIESVLPEVTMYTSEKARKRGRVGFRKVLFRDRIAGCYDTYQRIAPLTMGRRGGGGVEALIDDLAVDVAASGRDAAVGAVLELEERRGRRGLG